jgi:hypothetical protein
MYCISTNSFRNPNNDNGDDDNDDDGVNDDHGNDNIYLSKNKKRQEYKINYACIYINTYMYIYIYYLDPFYQTSFHRTYAELTKQ